MNNVKQLTVSSGTYLIDSAYIFDSFEDFISSNYLALNDICVIKNKSYQIILFIENENTNYFQYKLSNGLYGSILNNEIYIKYCNVNRGDDITTLLNFLLNHYKTVIIDDSYLISNQITLHSKNILKGVDKNTSILTCKATNCLYLDLSCNKCIISDLTLVGDSTHNGILFSNTGTLAQQDLSCVVENMLIRNFDNGINIENNFRDCRFSNIRIESSNTSGMTITGTDNRFSNVIISISNKHGFLVYGYSNDFTQCKAFCCGYGGVSGVGFNSQSAQYLRVIDCEFQQNRFQNLVLNNTFNSTFICMCDSAGWLETEQTGSDIKNIELNGSCYNNLLINLIDGRAFGDYSYCVQGIYSQYNNNNGNNIELTVQNVVADRDYQIATGICNTFIFSLKNRFIVNGGPYLENAYETHTTFDYTTPNLSNVVAEPKKLTYSNITSSGQYRIPIPLDTTQLGVYLDTIQADSGLTLTGSIIIRHSSTQYYTSPEIGISNAVGGKVYTADIASMIQSLGSVTINQIQLRLIVNGTTGGSCIVRDPRIIYQRQYQLSNG